jgi:hypothetical protein
MEYLRELWGVLIQDDPEDDSPEIEHGETAPRRFETQHQSLYRCFDPG